MSIPKRILIVSSNVLFAEVISQSLSSQPGLELIRAVPHIDAEEIKAAPPEVIIVDEAIGSEELGKILIASRELPWAQMLLMNLKGNDFVVLDSHKAVIRQATDLLNTIIKDETMNSTKGSNPGIPMEVIEDAKARAGMYGFLAALYNHRPDVDLVQRMRTVGIDSFIQMTEDEGASPDLIRGLHDMAQFIETTIGQPAEDLEQMLAVDWTRLFRGISPSYGPTPPYEGVFQGGMRDPMEVLQWVNAIYHENGVTIGDDSPNRPDYIGLELDFLRYLSEREAEAWRREDEELALSYADRGREFFEKHLGAWAWKFCDQALEHARTDFYKGFLRLTKGVIAEARNEERI